MMRFYGFIVTEATFIEALLRILQNSDAKLLSDFMWMQWLMSSQESSAGVLWKTFARLFFYLLFGFYKLVEIKTESSQIKKNFKR